MARSQQYLLDLMGGGADRGANGPLWRLAALALERRKLAEVADRVILVVMVETMVMTVMVDMTEMIVMTVV